MIDNKLFVIYKNLISVEKNAINKWLHSPAHNQRTDLIQFWEALQDKHLESMSPTERFAQVFPGEPFDNLKWRQLQSMLVAQIEEQFAWRGFREETIKMDLRVATEYRLRKIPGAQEHALKRAGERLAAAPKDLKYQEDRYLLAWEQYLSIETQQRSGGGYLNEVIRTFDAYALTVKLRLACLSASHQAVFQAQYDNRLTELLLKYLEDSEWLQEPIIALYYHCYWSLSSGEEVHFRAFRHFLESLAAQLPSEERRALLLMAVNYCIRELNRGETRYAREAFDLYKLGLESGSLIENGMLSRFALKNIVSLGIRLEAYDWVEKIILEYSPLLEAKHREANCNYNLAALYCAKKEYEKAMPLLAQVDEADLLLNLDSRIMLIKMYYETEAWDALDALLSSFRILLLRKKKMVGYHQQHYLNTVRLLQKILRTPAQDRAARQKIREEIDHTKSVIERDWLLGKVG